MNHSLPNRRNLKSPGSLPMPSFCNQGVSADSNTSARKMAMNQRKLHLRFQRMRTVACRKTQQRFRQVFTEGKYFE